MRTGNNGELAALRRARTAIGRLIAESAGGLEGDVRYHAKLEHARMIEDDYEQGEVGKAYYTHWDCEFDFDDKDVFIESFGSWTVIPDDVSVTYNPDTKRVVLNFTGNNDWEPLKANEVDKWKRGKFKAFDIEYHFAVTTAAPAPDADMIAMFGEA